MAYDWKPGDLALCVNAGFHLVKLTNGGLVAGRIYTVIEVVDGYGCDYGKVGLNLEELPIVCSHSSAFNAARFRKVRPHTPDAEDAETIRLLNERTRERVQ